ncbi:MAG: RNA methyltransferase [Verrucomicrobiales bacterium]|nr:RNA methyltransferase [Verrucomicrobiales bacterium]
MLNVVLYQPEIPPNTGNIGRLCHGSGTNLHLIEPLGFLLDDRSLKRAGLDYWAELEPTIWPSFDDFIGSVEESVSVYYFTTKARQIYWEAEYKKGDYLVFGPETRGLPESILRQKFDSCLTIPQVRGRSLNLATAVGIALYEGIRQLSVP